MCVLITSNLLAVHENVYRIFSQQSAQNENPTLPFITHFLLDVYEVVFFPSTIETKKMLISLNRIYDKNLAFVLSICFFPLSIVINGKKTDDLHRYDLCRLYKQTNDSMRAIKSIENR